MLCPYVRITTHTRGGLTITLVASCSIWDVSTKPLSGIKKLRISPNNPDYRMNLATLKLLLGDWPASWRDYETRWQTKEFVGSLPKYPQPRWQGEALQGKTLLLVAEQGLGDEIQFARLHKSLMSKVQTWCFK